MQENVTTIRMCMPFNYACRLKAPLLWRYSWHSRTLKSPLEVYEKSIGFLNPKKNLLYSVTTTSWQLMLPPNFHQGLEASSKRYTKLLIIWCALWWSWSFAYEYFWMATYPVSCQTQIGFLMWGWNKSQKTIHLISLEMSL